MNKNSKISQYKVRKIIDCFCVDIEASKTALILTMNRNTINRYHGLFRRAIYQHQQKRMEQRIEGNIELDESYFGARRKRGFHGKLKRGRGTLKQPIFAIFERDGQVYTEIAPDCKKATLQKVIKGKIALESVIYSDGW